MKGISGNVIKILAAILMVIDHIGVILFPNVLLLRIIGRLSFPLFAFMIAEGAKYTKNKLKYFLGIFILGIICQTFNYFFNGQSLYMCILITFSISILLIYLMDYFKKLIFDSSMNKNLAITISANGMIIALLATFFFCEFIDVDYGFFGILAPVMANIVDFRRIKNNELVSKYDKFIYRLLLFFIALVLLSLDLGWIQYVCIFSISILAFYNQERGKYKLKYFFYIFYPLHLAILYGIYMLITIF